MADGYAVRCATRAQAESARSPNATLVPEGDLLIPPSPTHGHQKLNRVLVALRLRANVAELSLLKLPLGIEQTDDARTAIAIADALQTYSL